MKLTGFATLFVSTAVAILSGSEVSAQVPNTKFTSMRSNASFSGGMRQVPHSPEEISFRLNEEGVKLILKGDKESGQRKIEQALEYNPRNTTALYNLAGLYLTEGTPEKAVQAMTQALEISPDDLAFLNRLAESHFANSDLRNSIQTYEKIVQADASYEKSLLRLGTLYGMVQEWDAAEKSLRRALAISPDDSRVISNLASVLVVQHKFREAIDLLDRLEPKELTSDIMTTKGVAYEGMGNKQAALEQFEAAAQAGKRDEDFLGKIGVLRKEISSGAN
ncbi:MAG: tetratricopeptide repeat protein [Bdellovibrionales bacterium]|nr:tetratricopeptide repeat protein [Bdellovibrionales bacterium]